MSPTSLEQLVRDARRNNDYSPLVELIPYAKLLGIECLRLGDDMVFRLPANKDNIGNPTQPAIHGGVIAGFMEHAAMLHLLTFMSIPHLPKIIDFSIDYLRAGHFRDTYAQCQVWRQGRRVANVAINAWQTTQGEPIATARAHFKVDEP
ncbi:PaaI family thioesterase [Pseudomonas aeruginosa]|nr:PaaI family thioesterase [Pseudomonas aeruginosa]